MYINSIMYKRGLETVKGTDTRCYNVVFQRKCNFDKQNQNTTGGKCGIEDKTLALEITQLLV